MKATVSIIVIALAMTLGSFCGRSRVQAQCFNQLPVRTGGIEVGSDIERNAMLMYLAGNTGFTCEWRSGWADVYVWGCEKGEWRYRSTKPEAVPSSGDSDGGRARVRGEISVSTKDRRGNWSAWQHASWWNGLANDSPDMNSTGDFILYGYDDGGWSWVATYWRDPRIISGQRFFNWRFCSN